MRIGMLTGGGDCPGLNAVIRGVVRRNAYLPEPHEIFGYRHGWRGVLEKDVSPLPIERTRGILWRGGTILGTSRTNAFKDHTPEEVLGLVRDAGLDALIAVGGEDTLGVAEKLAAAGGQIVGVPKTIDNDLSATEVTFGFDTAVQIATEAIDRLQTTAESHDRVIVCEVMGRHAGHIAVWAGIAGGAHLVLIPEEPFDIDEICARLIRRHESGWNYSIVVASEGARPKEGTLTTLSGDVDQFGHVQLGGIGQLLTDEIEKRTGFETRVTILGHIQRGGTPTAYDRVLSTRFGVAAMEAADQNDWGTMVALRCGEIERVPIKDATGAPKLVDPRIYDVARVFFG